ncbi:FAD-dependent monooxygenase [Ktedonospora formicarum]|uniref:FAD-dependent oxidoreductase n=1 Tax=Ktedonospora formicarum TaxID=2778364 RepID=A0A8J3MVS5_9CHLR|nr:FAD-dependent monooxygenase [Ktedonospora formicarum]GHO48236.1 FAD-dependent oxidoreductase [Ktedonospora formicarum]
MKNKHVLISGASLAGPALAYWLSRYGFQVTVVEKAPALRESGYKVDIRGVAVDVVERMGMLADVRQASTAMRGGTFVNSDNKPLATMSADFFNGRTERDDEIMRADLSRILYERTQDQVEYIFADSITSMLEDEGGVQVTFGSGIQRTFDLVVGADGLHSNVRKLAFGDEAQFIHQLGAYVSIFTTPNFLNLDHWELYYYAPGKFVSQYSSHDSSKAMNFFFFHSPALTYDYHDSEQQKQILAKAYVGAGWEIPRLLDYARVAPDFYFDSISLIKMEHWSRGRTVLLGDAAYCASPASGQGTGLALVGAYVLAGELVTASGDYQTAFARYEQAMRGYVAVNQKLAGAVKDFVPQTQSEIWLRTQVLRALQYLPWKSIIGGKMMRDTQEAANAITLKSYEHAEEVVSRV